MDLSAGPDLGVTSEKEHKRFDDSKITCHRYVKSLI
jgi:hypothetical protein